MPSRATRSDTSISTMSRLWTPLSVMPMIASACSKTGRRNPCSAPTPPGRPKKPPSVEATARRTSGQVIERGLSWMRAQVVASERVSLPQKVTKIMRKV